MIFFVKDYFLVLNILVCIFLLKYLRKTTLRVAKNLIQKKIKVIYFSLDPLLYDICFMKSKYQFEESKTNNDHK